MKRIKELYMKYEIWLLVKEMFFALYRMVRTIIKTIVYMPFYILYVNIVICIVGKMSNVDTAIILKDLNDYNIGSNYIILFNTILLILIYKWGFQTLLRIDKENECYTLGRKVSSLESTVKINNERTNTEQKAKFVLYENGVMKENRILEYDPNQKFTVSNMELEKTYLLLKEEIDYE